MQKILGSVQVLVDNPTWGLPFLFCKEPSCLAVASLYPLYEVLLIVPFQAEAFSFLPLNEKRNSQEEKILFLLLQLLILAFVLLPITGLGPLTGTLAVGIHSIGTLGKLSSEVIEGIDDGPLESIKSSGGSKLNVLFFGVVPQVMPTITSYWLYRFEINSTFEQIHVVGDILFIHYP